jgi:cell division protease FtsH
MNKKGKTPQQDPNEEKKRQENSQRQMKFGVSYLITSLIALWLFQQFILAPLAIQATAIPYSEFKTKLKAGEVSQITITDTRIIGQMKNPSFGGQNGQNVPFTNVMVPNGDPKLIEELDAAGVRYQVQEPPSPIGQFLLAYGLPLALLGGLWYYSYQRMGNAAGGMGSM